jgi:hypothetical protein
MMTARRFVRTLDRKESSRLPDWAAHVVCLLQSLVASGRLEAVGERLLLQRQGGYAGLDVWVSLLVYFASGLELGIRPFWEDMCRQYAAQLAAVAGRSELPSAASLSRALTTASAEEVRACGAWLLRQIDGFGEVLRHPAVRHLDTRGGAWHVFDFDHTVTTFYHRRLPSATGQPQGRRRIRAARPGYSGRKRGDVQLSRAALQHAGSGVWLDARIGPGNGEPRADFEHAVKVVVDVCNENELDTSRAIMRADGAFGHVPHISACRARGISLVSRLARYQLFDQPDVQRALQQATWYAVPGTVEPSVRFAAELGMVTLPPAARTVHADGSPYEPVRVRVVVTRRRDDADAAGWGHAMGGWRYELFVADLAPEDWPAPEVVALYAGRAAIENRFAQEDRELGLDRALSYEPSGQELATLAGLFVWNFDVVGGARLEAAKLSAFEPAPVERDAVAVEHDLGLPPAEQPASPEAPPPPADEHDAGALEARLEHSLAGVEWTRHLEKRPGWQQGASATSLRCPAGLEIALSAVHDSPSGSPGLIFRALNAQCRACKLSEACTGSVSPASPKAIRIPLAPQLDVPVRELLDERRRLTRRLLQERRERTTGLPTASLARPVARPLLLEPVTDYSAGPLRPLAPAFNAAQARKLVIALCARVEPHVTVTRPPRATPSTPLLRNRDRERRRTWQERVARNALADEASLHLDLHGAAPLDTLIHAKFLKG